MSSIRIIVSKKRDVWHATAPSGPYEATGATREAAIESLRLHVAGHFAANGMKDVEDLLLDLDVPFTKRERVEIWHDIIASAKKALERGNAQLAERLTAQAEELKAHVEKRGRKNNPNPLIAKWYLEFGDD